MYLLKFMLDRDFSIKDSIFCESTNENILFCEDEDLYKTLYAVLESFKGTKLDNTFYDALSATEGYWEEGNYQLEIIHDRGDIESAKNAFLTLTQRAFI